jgi:hypothetical protein
VFFEAVLRSPNGQCFEAKDWLRERFEWWN